nr:hypothetical protein [Streptomyces xanthophaeus]
MDNTPRFVRGVASDDTIRVEVDDEGARWAGEMVPGFRELHDLADRAEGPTDSELAKDPQALGTRRRQGLVALGGRMRHRRLEVRGLGMAVS